MIPGIKISTFDETTTPSVSALVPIIQDGDNLIVTLDNLTNTRWDSTYSTVSANSAAWDADTTIVAEIEALSGSWQSTYTTVSANSAAWDAHTDPYDDSLLQSTSATWDSTYSTVSANSAAWDAHTDPYDDSLLQTTSGDWSSTYTTVSSNSASWLNLNDQQTISSSNSALSLDVSLGESAVTTLTEHLTSFTISNAVSGDSGMLIISSDGGGWTLPADVYPSLIMAGDLADISTLTNSASSRITIGWYYDGQFNYLYVSSATL